MVLMGSGGVELLIALLVVGLLEQDVGADPGLLQLADGGQAVHGISRESAHTLGHNQVDFSGKGIPDHAVEAVPALGVDGADALIGVDLHEVPVGVLLN